MKLLNIKLRIISMLQYLYFSILFISIVQALQMSQAIDNIAVYKGQHLQMTCGHIQAVKVVWSFWGVGEKPIQANIIDGSDQRRVVSSFIIGFSTLKISTVENGDAGTYECSLRCNGSTAKVEFVFYAQLIVIESKIRCKTNEIQRDDSISVKENQVVRFQCIVLYTGNWNPVMEWTTADKEKTVMTAYVSYNITKHHVESSLTIMGTARSMVTSYFCTTFFQKNVAKNILAAGNIPHFNFTWKSPRLDVLYGPKEVTMFPSKSEFNVGDYLTCSADANPTAVFLWKDITNDEIIQSGPVLPITKNMTPTFNYSYECLAMNEIGNISTVIHFSVSAGDTFEYFMVLTILPIALGLVYIAWKSSHLKHIEKAQYGETSNTAELASKRCPAPLPDCSEMNKVKIPESSSQQPCNRTEHDRKCTINLASVMTVGKNGTIYSDIRGLRACSAEQPPRNVRCNDSDSLYAEMDHGAPILPPRRY